MTENRTKRRPIRRYEDIDVYRDALELAVALHEELAEFPPSERYRIIDQLGRSSASIGAHIAEGWGRKASTADFKRYLRMALGEIQETKYWVEFSTRLGYLDEDQGRSWWKSYDELAAQMYTFMANWTDFDSSA